MGSKEFVFAVNIIKDVSMEVAYLIIFCISGSIVLIIPNHSCYPFNIKLKEDIQFNEEDVILLLKRRKVVVTRNVFQHDTTAPNNFAFNKCLTKSFVFNRL